MRSYTVYACFFAWIMALCATHAGPLAEGYYVLEAPFFYEKGLCLVQEKGPDLYTVEMLELRKGRFDFKVKGGKKLKIVNAQVSFDKIRRSLKGHGEITGLNRAEGEGTAWIKTVGFFSRNRHRGSWKFYPADYDHVKRKLERLREDTGMDLPDIQKK